MIVQCTSMHIDFVISYKAANETFCSSQKNIIISNLVTILDRKSKNMVGHNIMLHLRNCLTFHPVIIMMHIYIFFNFKSISFKEMFCDL